MHKNAALIALFSIFLLLCGCAGQKNPAVEVRVFDLDSGSPIANATVQAYGQTSTIGSAKTDSQGIALIGIPSSQGKPIGGPYDFTASANGYSGGAKSGITASDFPTITFQLEKIKSSPIPKGRYYEDAVISDSLHGIGRHSGRIFTVFIYKIILNGSGGSDRAMFRLTEFGNTLSTKVASPGMELAQVFADENGSALFSDRIVVKSIGYDAPRELGYTDVTFGN